MEECVVELDRDVAVLASALKEAATPAALAGVFGHIRRLVAGLAGQGRDALEVGRLASRLYDGLLVRAAALARDGPDGLPPGCALAVLGSQGRREQFLATDQDNALILNNASDAPDMADADGGYERFAQALARVLEAAGVPACPKGIMAATPGWRKTVAAWGADIDTAAARPDAAAVLLVSLLADLRPVAGDPELVAAVTRRLGQRLAEAPLLVRGLAREALRFGPPTLFFGHLPVEFLRFGATVVDLKRAAVYPLTLGVKALALDAGIWRTGTTDRLEALAGQGVLGQGLTGRLRQAFGRVQAARLAAQAASFVQGRPMDNRLDLGALPHEALHDLRDALRTIGELREILEHHFGLRYLT